MKSQKDIIEKNALIENYKRMEINEMKKLIIS